MMSYRMTWLAVASMLAIGTISQSRADIVVAATESIGASNSILGTLDLTTGQFTQTASLSMGIDTLTSGIDGTLYAAAEDGHLYTVGASGALTQFGSSVSPGTLGTPNSGYFGLVSAGTAGFYATIYGENPANLYRVTPDGNSVSAIGSIGPYPALGSGSLVRGPDGSLYYEGANSSGAATLYRVNPSTGTATAIGSGLAPDPLTLVTAGGILYGIDTSTASGSTSIDVYTINTITGVATDTGVSVTGLTTGYTLDAATAVVLTPNSLFLIGTGLATAAAAMRLKRSVRD